MLKLVKIVGALILIIPAIIISEFVVITNVFKERAAAPAQPIMFPHKTHVSEVGLACAFCHAYAGKSRVADVPPVSLCMDCHTAVAADKPEIKKLTQYFENKEPVPWNRVHSLPDFVYFSHKRHIKAGVDCSVCHGEVKLMTVDRRVKPLTMGWCVSCHRSHSAPTDCLICHK